MFNSSFKKNSLRYLEWSDGVRLTCEHIHTDKRQWQTFVHRQTQPAGLFSFTRMHLPYPQAHLASVKRGRATTVSCTKITAQSPCAHNHTNVANSEQLRLATFSQPTFFSHRPLLPRQQAGKLQLTHLFSKSHTHKQNCGACARIRLL